MPHDQAIFEKFSDFINPNGITKTYTATDVMVPSVYTKMEEKISLVYFNMDALCAIIPKQDEDCRRHPKSCKNSNIQKETIGQLSRTEPRTSNISILCVLLERDQIRRQ